MFCRYLAGQPPSGYVIDKYVAYHALAGQPGEAAPEGFDRLLVRVAMMGRHAAWLVDAYTGWFYRGSAVRTKLVVLLAILECSPPYCERLEAPDRRGRLRTLARMLAAGAGDGAALVLAGLMLAPVHAAARLGRRAGLTGG